MIKGNTINNKKSLQKNYETFIKALNSADISWSFLKYCGPIKDNGYANEIDLITETNNRERIRRIARHLGWFESSLNNFNNHLYFIKLEGDKPFRIDIHVGRALATTVPWFSAKEILNESLKVGNLWLPSKRMELAILIMASFRGRKIEDYYAKRAIELKSVLPETKELFSGKLNENFIEKAYSNLINRRPTPLSTIERLGITGLFKYWGLNVKLFFLSRFSNPSPFKSISFKDEHHRREVEQELDKLAGALKMNIKITDKQNSIEKWWNQRVHDAVILSVLKSENTSGFHRKNDELNSKKIVEQVMRHILESLGHAN